MVLRVQPEDVESDEARGLVAELDELLNGLYSLGDQALDLRLLDLRPEDVEDERGTFLMARESSASALGCGAIRRIGPTTGELKRMYVRPAARNLGVGRAILEALEEWAVAAGMELIVLETGIEQPSAMRFYEQAGYEAIDPYGASSGSDQSICYGKRLC